MEAEVEVTVGGRSIAVSDVRREAQYHPAQSWSAACHEAKRALVVRELMLREAARLGYWDGRRGLSERDCQALVERVTASSVVVPPVHDEACEQFYRENRSRFIGPELFEASHILLPTSANAVDVAQLRARAESVLGELLRHPERFERAARESSACPSAASGGRLGQLTPGETHARFEAALRQLRPGEIHPRLVETRHGFHIIRLDQFCAGRELPLAAVQERIRLYLRERAWRAELRAFLRRLASRFELQGFDLDAPPPSETAEASSNPSARKRLPVLH